MNEIIYYLLPCLFFGGLVVYFGRRYNSPITKLQQNLVGEYMRMIQVQTRIAESLERIEKQFTKTAGEQ
jgi:hypothetical protein